MTPPLDEGGRRVPGCGDIRQSIAVIDLILKPDNTADVFQADAAGVWTGLTLHASTWRWRTGIKTQNYTPVRA